jgi:hypothetical protein
MLRLIALIFTIVSHMIVTDVQAKDISLSVDYIRGEGDVEGVKLAGQYHTNWVKQYLEHAELYFETSLNFWEYGAENNRDTNFVFAISPVILYPLTNNLSYDLFVEFGIGFSLLTEREFAGKDVGSHYQFEDRLGIVWRYGKKRQHQVAVRYFHYSNAGLSHPNPGLDFISLSYTQRLF